MNKELEPKSLEQGENLLTVRFHPVCSDLPRFAELGKRSPLANLRVSVPLSCSTMGAAFSASLSETGESMAGSGRGSTVEGEDVPPDMARNPDDEMGRRSDDR